MQTAPTPPASPLRLAFRATRGGFAVVLAFSFFLNLLVLASPIYMMQVFDRVLGSGRVETLIYLTVIAGVAMAVLGALDAVRSMVLARISTWLDRELGGVLLATGVSGTLAGLAPGAQPLRDLGQVRNFISGGGILPAFDAPWVPLLIAVLWWMHPWLGLLGLASALLLLGLALLSELASRRPLAEANQRSIASFKLADGAIRNAETVQAMGLMPQLVRRWRRGNDLTAANHLSAADRTAVISGAAKFVRLFVQMAILGLGALLVLRGELTGGGMIAASILLGRALGPVEQAIGFWRGLVGARAGFDRLEQLMAAVPAKPAAMRLPAPKGRLTVDRLVYVPPGAKKPVLKQVTFSLAPGELLGLVGGSAAGKSTLCRLLVGAVAPTDGSVRLDAAEVHSWDRPDFGRHVGYLPQGVELFAGTVHENIARLAPSDPEEVVRAAELAGVHELVLQLAEGYETEVGDNGAMLLGGQRQRIGLARALFGNPKLLVLDEPNANLDPDGEAALQRAITTMKQRGSTIVVATPRPLTLDHVDRLLELRDGAVWLFGPRDKVLKRQAEIAQAGAQRAKPVVAAGE